MALNANFVQGHVIREAVPEQLKYKYVKYWNSVVMNVHRAQPSMLVFQTRGHCLARCHQRFTHSEIKAIASFANALAINPPRGTISQ